MPRKIILDDTMLSCSRAKEQSPENYSPGNDGIVETRNDLVAYSEILKAAIAQYPNKMLFSIKDTAAALSVSPEFIRKKISDGNINSVTLGDRKMVSINELARIIYKGI